MKKCPKCAELHVKPGIFCSRICANSRGPRTEAFKETVRRIRIANPIGFVKHQIPSKPKFCEICGARCFYKRQNKNKTCSPECLSLLRTKIGLVKNKGTGGKRHGSGRGKKGYYNGIWCDSTYELAYLIYCLDHGINIQRFKGHFEYEDSEGVRRKYHPDFEVDGVIVEIKGYVTENVRRKIESVNRPIRLLTRVELKPVFEYVTTKTGLSPLKYHTLYEAG